jgi:hypothetical protein
MVTDDVRVLRQRIETAIEMLSMVLDDFYKSGMSYMWKTGPEPLITAREILRGEHDEPRAGVPATPVGDDRGHKTDTSGARPDPSQGKEP